MEKIIFLDTETTDGDKQPGMIQLGYIVCDLNFNEIKRKNLFFSTDKTITFEAMAVHHITSEILEKKLLLDCRINQAKKDEAMEDFKRAYLIAHNSPFDKNVLDCNGITTDYSEWIDSYNIAYHVYDNDDFKHNLQYLRYALGCKFDEEVNPHDAMSDVIVLREVFAKIYNDYMSLGTGGNPFEEMVDLTNKGIILRKWAFGKYNGQKIDGTFKKDPGYFEWMYNLKLSSGDTEDNVFNTLKYYLKK